MKKNDWILAASVAVYSYLFYQQNLGINFLVFTFSLIVLLFLRNKEVVKSKSWILAAVGSLLSAFCISYYGNVLSFTTNIISLCVLSAFSLNPSTSIITSFFFSLYSIGASYVFMILDTIERCQKKTVSTAESKPISVKLMLYIVPLFIAVIFLFMYKASNPLFDNFTKKINLDFISAGWIFFTLGGLCLLYGFFYHKNINTITNKDQMASNLLFAESTDAKSSVIKFLSIDNEKLSGIILLLLLNSLLFTVNILDVNFLWFDGALPKDLSYSAFVHQGTGALITSIIIAILIILYYFRGELNFYKGNKSLKLLAGLWIMQNAFMIVSTAYRNNLYINEYSLTFKRIGVYVWLLLVLIGLLTTFIKILKAKSNWYLFRINGWLFYSVLLFSCFINWDVLVTNFNINRAEQKHKPLDKLYLISLSEKSIPQLLTMNDSIKNQTDNEDNFETRGDVYRYEYADINYKPALHYKLYRFLDEMKKMEWQSFCFEKNRVYKEVASLKRNIKEIDLQNYYLETVKPIELLDNLQTLYFSNNNLKDLRELKMFPVLENLYLNSNRFDSIDFFSRMNNLKMLSLSNNNIKSLSPLMNVPNIVFLDLSDNKLIDIGTMPVLNKLTTLSLYSNSTTDYTALLRLPYLQDLNIGGTVINKGTILPPLPKLLRLNLQNTQISLDDSNLFERLSDFVSLEYLDLSDNQLENLTPLIADSKNTAIANGMSVPLCKALKSLNVSRNKLQTLYSLIVYSNLEELHVSDNQLGETTSLSQLINLKTLSIDNCGLNTIDFIKKLKNLEVLNISNNNIVDFTPLYELKNLKQLYLGNVRKELLEKLKKQLPATNINAYIIK